MFTVCSSFLLYLCNWSILSLFHPQEWLPPGASYCYLHEVVTCYRKTQHSLQSL